MLLSANNIVINQQPAYKQYKQNVGKIRFTLFIALQNKPENIAKCWNTNALHMFLKIPSLRLLYVDDVEKSLTF